MKLGIDAQKLPEFRKRGPMASLDLVHELGLGGIFFPTALDMSPTLDAGYLRDLRAKADDLGLYLESGLGKINPYCSAEAPELRAAGDGDIIAGFTRMIEANAAIGCFELWVSPGNFKPAYRGRLAVDRFRTDVTWDEQLTAIEKVLKKLAPAARANGVHLNIETHDEITSFEILRLIEAVGPDCVGVVFDTANMVQRGEHPVWAAKRLAPHIRQTHIKDALVARAPGGLDFQPRTVRHGGRRFRRDPADPRGGRPRPEPVARDRAVDGGQPAPAQSAPVHPDRRSGLAGGPSGPDAGGAGGLSRHGRRLRAADRRGRGRELGELRDQPLRLSDLRAPVLRLRRGDRLHRRLRPSYRSALRGEGPSALASARCRSARRQTPPCI